MDNFKNIKEKINSAEIFRDMRRCKMFLFFAVFAFDRICVANQKCAKKIFSSTRNFISVATQLDADLM